MLGKESDTLISIIVPMYNTEDKIEQCLSSLQKQDYHNIEIILIDDGSTDRSLDICKKIAKNDARIKIITKENAGVAAARIDGLKISKGEYIAFVDSDDFVAGDYISKMYQAMMKYNVELVFCQQYIYSEQSRICISTELLPQDGYYDRKKIEELLQNKAICNYHENSDFCVGIIMGLVCKLWHRKLAQIALNEGKNLWYGEDAVGVIKVLYHINSMVVIPDRLYYYRQNEFQTTKTYKEGLMEQHILVARKFSEMDQNGYFSEQIPRLIQKDILKHLNLCAQNCTYPTFKKEFLKIQKSESENIKTIYFNKKKKIALSLVKLNLPLVYFYISKIRNFIKYSVIRHS